MAFHELIGNQRARDILERGILSERLHQSLIFSGGEGIGKRQFALAVAQAFNCPRSPGVGCGDCPACVRVRKNEHPDVKIVQPDGAFIKVQQIREVLELLSFEPFEGRRRVVVFDSAERMNVNSANALLKMLEEPPPHAMLILVTANPSALLETIRSRCQILRFGPVSVAEMESFLEANFRRPADENRLLARISQGFPGRAVGADLTVFRTLRKEALELIELLGRRKQKVRLLKAAGHFGKSERDEFETRLGLIATVLRDIACFRTDAPADLATNIDIMPRLVELAGLFTPERLADLSEGFETIRRNLSRNINRTVALEAFFLTFTKT